MGSGEVESHVVCLEDTIVSRVSKKYGKIVLTSVSVLEYSYSHSASFSGSRLKAGAVNGVAKGSLGGESKGAARKGAANCAITVCG